MTTISSVTFTSITLVTDRSCCKSSQEKQQLKNSSFHVDVDVPYYLSVGVYSSHIIIVLLIKLTHL